MKYDNLAESAGIGIVSTVVFFLIIEPFFSTNPPWVLIPIFILISSIAFAFLEDMKIEAERREQYGLYRPRYIWVPFEKEELCTKK